jgi:phospholipase/carboxylesterase
MIQRSPPRAFLARPRSVLRAWRWLVLALLAALLAPFAVHAIVVAWKEWPPVPIAPEHETGWLKSRPHAPIMAAEGPGVWPLGLARFRDGVLYVPTTLRRDRPVGLVLWFHGHSGEGVRSMKLAIPAAERAGFLILAPSSRRVTWDAIRWKRFGPDVALIDAALAHVFDRFDVDPRRIAIAGNSDGASYALSLGLINGDLFTRVIAFAPGQVVAGVRRGRPPIFIAHGRQDRTHLIERTGRVISEEIRADGYPLTYQEFDAGHALPPEAFQQGLADL